jgi:hypothetical protein
MFFFYSKVFLSRVLNLTECLFRTEYEAEAICMEVQTFLDDAMQKPEDKQALR